MSVRFPCHSPHSLPWLMLFWLSLFPAVAGEAVPPRSEVHEATVPLQWIHLPCGESFPGRLLTRDASVCVLQTWRGERLTVPTESVVGVRTPQRERLRWWDSFEQPHARWTCSQKTLPRSNLHAAHGRFALEFNNRTECHTQLVPPCGPGRIALAFHVPERSADGREWGVDFSGISEGNPVSLRVALGNGDEVYSVSPRGLKTHLQRIPRHPGWHACVLIAQQDRCRVLIDDAILADISQPVAVNQIQFFHNDTDHTEAALIDSVSVTDTLTVAAPLVSQNLPEQDRLTFHNGDELHGQVMEVTESQITLKMGKRNLTLSREELQEITFRQSESQGAVVRGRIVEVVLQSPASTRWKGPFRLVGALEPVGEAGWKLHHPWLGILYLPTHSVSKITPMYEGTFHRLDSRVHHLGDEAQTKFAVVRPGGSVLKVPFELDTVPPGRYELYCDVTELEAAAPDAPPATAYLDQLRAGFLLTGVYLNGVHLGSLNRKVTYKTSPGATQRVTLSVPAALLRAGQNHLILKQRPSRGQRENYDDCEIRNLTLQRIANP